MFARVRVASTTSSAASSTGPAAPPRRLRLVEPRLPALRRGRLSFANCVGGANAAAAAPASSVAAASRTNAIGCDGDEFSAGRLLSSARSAQPLTQKPLNPAISTHVPSFTCPAGGRLRGKRVHAVAKMMRDMVGGGCGPDGANPLAKMMQGSGGGLPHRTLSRLRVLRACSLSRTDADRAPHMQAELRPRRVRRSFKGSIMAGTTLCSR